MIQMLLQGVEAFPADDVFDTAGIFCSRFFRNTEFYQTGGDKFVPLVDHLSNLTSAVCQINKSGIRYRDMLFLTQIFHGNADAGFFKSQFVCNIHGTNNRKFFAED